MTESDLAARANERVGRTLRAKYRLDRVLGVGSTAAVYAATHRNGKEFAVKMLHPELSLHSEIRARFLREGYAANALKHPGAVTVLDDDLDDAGVAFLVMELLDGETVDHLWRRQGRRLGLEVVLDIAQQVLDVLVAAHSRGVIHRDIKPANLFLTRSGRLKVLDFGIARLSDASLLGTGGPTQTGMMVGTPAFMAPEQAQGKGSQIDGQTDVWAVGATLFTLLSGHAVHEASNAQQILLRAATVEAKPLTNVAPYVPVAMAQVVDRALAFQKSARWRSASAMADAMHDVYARGSFDLGSPSPSATTAARVSAAESGSDDAAALPEKPAERRYVLASLLAASTLVVGLGLARVGFAPPAAPAKGAVANSPESPLSQRDERPRLETPSASTSASPPPFAPSAAISSTIALRSTISRAPAAKTTPQAAVAGATKSAGSGSNVSPIPTTAGLGNRSAGANLRTTTSSVSAAGANCSPNYVFDSEGNKHFKPECF